MRDTCKIKRFGKVESNRIEKRYSKQMLTTKKISVARKFQ